MKKNTISVLLALLFVLFNAFLLFVFSSSFYLIPGTSGEVYCMPFHRRVLVYLVSTALFSASVLLDKMTLGKRVGYFSVSIFIIFLSTYIIVHRDYDFVSQRFLFFEFNRISLTDSEQPFYDNYIVDDTGALFMIVETPIKRSKLSLGIYPFTVSILKD